jgi:hypothetical protein
MGEVLLGFSGWNYPDTADKGGWTGVFYPDKDTKRLRFFILGKTRYEHPKNLSITKNMKRTTGY